MSFLYPLLLAGATLIIAPILAHMIRNRTRKRVHFSSLMFVPVTMPRFTRRSRVENLPLLIIRCLIICLLAAAFARPFFAGDTDDRPANPAKRTVVLVDGSASMRRTGLWANALAEVRKVLDAAGPADRVCVMAFDRSPVVVTGFEAWGQMESGAAVPAVMGSLASLTPGWSATDAGRALIAAAEAIEEDDLSSADHADVESVIVLVSDIQQGSDLDALASYEWPAGITVSVKPVDCQQKTNASAHWIAGQLESASLTETDKPMVRVTNSFDAAAEKFKLQWSPSDNSPTDVNDTAEVYVAPGYSAVARIGAADANRATGRIVLSGDDHDFDNTLYVAPRLRQKLSILYLGEDDPANPRQMLYYVERLFTSAGALQASVTGHRPAETIDPAVLAAADFVIIAADPSPANAAAIKKYVQSGRSALLVITSPEQAPTLAALTGASPRLEEARVDRYAMLARLDFGHPILAPFAEPRFGDFSRLHFWKYRRLDPSSLPQARVIGTFDTGDPAWLEVPLDRGSLLVWTCGWARTDSDLALSSKFIPLMYAGLEYGGAITSRRNQYFVGDSVPLPRAGVARTAQLTIRRPDGSTVTAAPDQAEFTATDIPGLYTIDSPEQTLSFAVNIPVRESRTAPMALEEIEKMGVAFEADRPEATPGMLARQQQASIAALESRQKLWRWLVVAALALLLVEITLAGLLTRPALSSQGDEQ